MHELAISSAVVETALEHAKGRRIVSVRLRVGRLRQVVPDSLSFYFGIAARDTGCEGAELDLELVDALLGCRECGREWDPAPRPAPDDPAGRPGDPILLPRFRCPACAGAGAEVLRGEELEVESIEVEEREASGQPSAGGDVLAGRS